MSIIVKRRGSSVVPSSFCCGCWWLLLMLRAMMVLAISLLVKASRPTRGSPKFLIKSLFCSNSFGNAGSDADAFAITNVTQYGEKSHDESEIISESFPAPTIIDDLLCKYKGKFVNCPVPHHTQSEIFLCGTLHVASTSVEMVADVLGKLRPDYIVLELCEGRSENLCVHETIPVKFIEILKESVSQRSIKTLGMGLLTWMQSKAAGLMGNKLGGELTIAAKIGLEMDSTIVLGDRRYEITIQRVMDQLSFFSKLRVGLMLVWEALTMNMLKIKDYIKQTESDDKFIVEEIARLRKHIPAFATVIIDERDEYLAETLCEIGTPPTPARPVRVVAVVGAGHLQGIQRLIAAGGVSGARMAEISRSSKHLEPTWPGPGTFQVVNKEFLKGEV